LEFATIIIVTDANLDKLIKKVQSINVLNAKTLHFVKVASIQVNILNILSYANLQIKENGSNVKIGREKKNWMLIKDF
jgi:hypothetical protein